MMKRILALVTLLVVTSFVVSAQEIVAEYEQIFKEGIEAFDSRNYKTALSKFRKVVNMPETSPALREQADEFIKTCNKHLVVSSSQTAHASSSQTVKATQKFEVSPSNLSIPAAGGTKEITIECNAEWEIMFKPEWCKAIESTDVYLKIWCDENTSLQAREGELVLSAGKEVKSVHLFQEKGTYRSGQVYFRTTPGNATIEIYDSGLYGLSSRAHKLSSGQHEVRVTKDGYVPFDTTIVVPVIEDGRTAVFDIALEPEFGILVPDIVMEDNGRTPPEVSFRINRRLVDLSNPAEGFSFDDDGGVIYNTLYKGGRIPLLPGVYEILAEAEGYEDFRTNVKIMKGETVNLSVDMNYISGWLMVVDDRNAEGAEVIVDEIGFSGALGEKMRIPVGEYLVEVRKEGYMLDDGILEIKIDEGTEIIHKASMTRMVNCLISTDVGGETVFVNGEKVPYQQPMHVIPLAEGQTYEVEVQKKDYWPYTASLTVTKTDTVMNLQNLKLRQVAPLKIRYDEPKLTVSLRSKDASDECEYAAVTPKEGTDTTLYVPYGKYELKLMRGFEPLKGRRTAYKGNLNFSEKRNTFRVQTRSRRSFVLLGGDYNLSADKILAEGGLPLSASAYFGQIKLWNGLSTSILRASAFNSSAVVLPFENSGTLSPEWVLGASCLMTNFDFRLGGGFCQYGDVAFIMSYAWCPPLTFALPLTHFSGHEAFAGVEISSRIPVFNVNLKVGAQYLNGIVNCFDPASGQYTKVSDRFSKCEFDNLSFVATLGFTLGGRDSKGRNVLRLW